MIATAAAVAFVVFSCKGKLNLEEKKDLTDLPIQVVDNMFVVQTENGLLKMRMEADRMERYDNDSLSYELFPDGFSAFTYNEDGMLETTRSKLPRRLLSIVSKPSTWTSASW